jgi:hypothetical protein
MRRHRGPSSDAGTVAVRPVDRGRARSFLITAVLALGVVACTDARVSGPADEAGNVEALIGAIVAQSDTGVVVNGRPVLSHPPNGRAVWLEQYERFDLGGFPELDHPQSADYWFASRVLLTHQEREEHGDSLIFRHHDHGDVLLAGQVMDRMTDPPAVGPGGPPIRFEDFLRYRLQTFLHIEWRHGATTAEQAPFHADLAAGRTLTLKSTGSAGASPVEAEITATPLSALVRIENDGPVALAGAVPVIDTRTSLVLQFDRPLDGSRAFVLLHPMFPERQPGVASVFLAPRSATDRVVVPPHVLGQLVAGAPRGSHAFRMIVLEVVVQDDVFTGILAPGSAGAKSFSLPFVQRRETALHLYLDRP